MRIALDSRLANIDTGTGRVTYGLFYNLIKSDKDNHYIVLFHNKDPFPDLDVEKFDVGRGNDQRFTYIWQLFVLPQILNRLSIDIFFSVENMVYPLFFKGTTIVSIQDLIPLSINNYYDRLYDKIKYKIKILSLKLLKKRDRIFTVSNFSKNEIIKKLKIKSDKIFVVPNAVSSFETPRNTDKVLKNLKIDFPYILAIGGGEARKNNKTLIKAFVKSKVREHLVIVGDTMRTKQSSQFDNLKEQNKVHLIGRVTDKELASLYKNANLFVFLSYYEGFGLPILEAFSYKVPVIAANKTSLPEVAGDGALLVNPHSEPKIKECIKKILKDDKYRQDLVKKSQKILKQFSWERSAQIFTDNIKNIKIDG